MSKEMLECKLASAPIEQNHKKSFDEEGAKFIANLAIPFH